MKEINISENVEFGWLNIVLGALLSLQIFGFIARTLYEIFPKLGFVLVIILFSVMFFVWIVMWKEMK